MLGYLNAPSPFTDDGWFNTGDKVEVDGDYFRILGRQSEIINVGGQKVYPAQVESVVQEMPEVAEVSVYGEKNAIMGQIVCAAIRLREPRDARAVPSRAQAVLPAAASGVSDSGSSQAGGKCDARRTLQKESARKRGQLMKFKPDTLASVHEQMALVKAQSTGGFFTNYFRQEMVGPQILSAATARSSLVGQ